MSAVGVSCFCCFDYVALIRIQLFSDPSGEVSGGAVKRLVRCTWGMGKHLSWPDCFVRVLGVCSGSRFAFCWHGFFIYFPTVAFPFRLWHRVNSISSARSFARLIEGEIV